MTTHHNFPCSICFHSSSQILCVSCAQASVWESRTQILFATAARDETGDIVQEQLESSVQEFWTKKAEAEGLRERLKGLRQEVERLRDGRGEDKAQIEHLRSEVALRRKKLEDARKVDQKRRDMLEGIKTEVKKMNQKSKMVYTRMIEARSQLCREAAGLYGLRLKRRRSGRVEYLIGGIPIPNLLTDLNTHQYTNFNVSLSHLSHLLVLVSHYLGLKLPHEIILSNRENPNNSIRGLLNNRLITRPLNIDSPLSSLSREDPQKYSRFLEGISMLSLNVSWLCYSQGLPINEVEDATNMGLCMWKLLVAKDSTAVDSPTFGKVSHATISGYLANARNSVVMKDFKLRPNLIADRIRYTLQQETMAADWDMMPEAGRERRRSVQAFEEEAEELLGPTGPSSVTGGVGRWTRIRARNDE
ncbi:UV radiation resistance protein and autophagy-related subunit 14-domain-containing protein [Pyronema omphalodes]|nr:UV radiation resistance protein and autophagy-related subunit 14-domain-containing protein [Pyronema omphalodes]